MIFFFNSLLIQVADYLDLVVLWDINDEIPEDSAQDSIFHNSFAEVQDSVFVISVAVWKMNSLKPWQ